MSGFKITELWAWVAIDPNDGDEGVVADYVGGMWYPMIGADEERVKSMEKKARDRCNTIGATMRLIKLHLRTDIKTIEPDSGHDPESDPKAH